MIIICGIAGVISQTVNVEVMLRMLASMRSRGPDDEGIAIYDPNRGSVEPLLCPDTAPQAGGQPTIYTPSSATGNVLRSSVHAHNHSAAVLGNRRLAIRDLSSLGHQPMCNEDGSVWITYNGEIYNYTELRKALEASGHRFLSNTDTEVVIHAYEQWGEECFHRFNGMWGMAILDLRRKVLVLSRDRLGIKPLYYARLPMGLVFASEIKAILQHPQVNRSPNESVLYEYLARNLQRISQETFYEHIFSLSPGHYMSIDLRDQTILESRPYWSPLISCRAYMGKHKINRGVREEFLALLEDAVALRLTADVRLGSCLSGGLDSSAIVCVAKNLIRNNKLRRCFPGADQGFPLFSARFHNPKIDEGPWIKSVIEWTGAQGYDVWPEDAHWNREKLTEFLYTLDEPVRSLSVYAQSLVYRTAHEKGVKVTLDGQGGDELLGGYVGASIAYIESLIWNGASVRMVKKAVQRLLKLHPEWAPITVERINRYLDSPNYQTIKKYKERLLPLWSKLASSQEPVKTRSRDWLSSDFRPPRRRTLPLSAGKVDPFEKYVRLTLLDPGLTHLLRYADRNSMAASIENRTPFLDHRLVEFMLQQPAEYWVGDGTPKRLLREVTKGILPEEVRTRHQKVGFAYPMDTAFRGELRNILLEMLKEPNALISNYVNVATVKNMLGEHSANKANHGSVLWRVLNAEIWLRSLEREAV